MRFSQLHGSHSSLIVFLKRCGETTPANWNRCTRCLFALSWQSLQVVPIPFIPFILVDSFLKTFETGMKGMGNQGVPTQADSAHYAVEKRTRKALSKGTYTPEMTLDTCDFCLVDLATQPDGSFVENHQTLCVSQ